MLPPPEKFSSRVRKLGLGDGVRIVVYDQRGLFSAARVWWTFRAFGHGDVVVLDGGLPKWLAEGRPVEDGAVSPGERHFTARMNSLMVRDKAQLTANLSSGREQVLDARSRGRFEGRDPEPRESLRITDQQYTELAGKPTDGGNDDPIPHVLEDPEDAPRLGVEGQ